MLTSPLSTLAALAWQVECGADEVLAESPGLQHWPEPSRQLSSRQPSRDGLSAVAAPTAQPQATPPQRSIAAVGAPTTPRPSMAAPVVVQAATLSDLAAEVAAFTGCPLRDTATQAVFGTGNPRAKILLLGEAPDTAEDRAGQPFVGANGTLLDHMLASIGLDREQVYLSNVLYWRPPGNRAPTDTEIATCWPFCARLIALLQPQLLLLAGAVAVKAVLRSPASMTRLRGTWQSYVPAAPAAAPIPTMPLYHPAHLLRQPQAKRQAWNDLLAIEKHLAATNLLNQK
jgi:uracil-DNA glycosylase